MWCMTMKISIKISKLFSIKTDVELSNWSKNKAAKVWNQFQLTGHLIGYLSSTAIRLLLRALKFSLILTPTWFHLAGNWIVSNRPKFTKSLIQNQGMMLVVFTCLRSKQLFTEVKFDNFVNFERNISKCCLIINLLRGWNESARVLSSSWLRSHWHMWQDYIWWSCETVRGEICIRFFE